MERDRSSAPKQPERKPYQPTTPLTPEQSAAIHGIPEANREHPVVEEFTSLHARLDQLITDTLRAHTDHDRPTKDSTLARERELLHAPDMRIPLADRYYVANALLVAAQQFLTEGTDEVASDPEPYAFRKLRDALSRLGYDLYLEKRPPTVYRFDDVDLNFGE